MKDALQTWLATILAMLLLFIFPLQDNYQRQDDMSELIAQKTVTSYVDTIRDRGVITPGMWSVLMEDLRLTGYSYEVIMEHYEKNYVPIYSDPMQHNSFNNEFMVHHQLVHHEDIMKKLFPNTTASNSDPSRLYRLKVGDYVQVTVKRLDESRSSKLSTWLIGSADPESAFSLPIGGMVRNETD